LAWRKWRGGPEPASVKEGIREEGDRELFIRRLNVSVI
jgi:hypothetical protein